MVRDISLWTALVTPFSEGNVDLKIFEKLIERQIEAGVRGLLLFGSTGETATLSVKEMADLSAVVQESKADASVMIGITHNNTQVVVESAKQAEQWGADVLLIAPPFYNKPTQEGIKAHFEVIAQSTKLPIVLYNIPSRVSVSIEAQTLLELAVLDNVIGVKEAANDQLLASLAFKDGLTVWSGDDPTILPYMSLGATGGISVNSNLFPGEMLKMIELYAEGRALEARELALRFAPWYTKVYSQTNPIGIKTAMALKGLIKNEFRLPLTQMATQNTTQLKKALEELDVALI